MNDRLKRILLIVGFVVSVIAFAVILYFMFFQGFAPDATVEEEIPDDFGSLPDALEGLERFLIEDEDLVELSEADTVARGGVTQTVTLTTSDVSGTVINGDDLNYYDPTDGRFYTINEDGEVVALSDKQFPEVENVVWNKDSNKAVLEFPDDSNVIYNFDSEKQVTLPSHWEDFDFSPVADEIVAKSIGLDPNNRWLVLANDDGSNIRAFQALGQNQDKVDVNWSPNDQVVAFADTVESREGGFDRKFIIPVGKEGENFKGLTTEGIDFISLWSPNGKKLLYSAVGDYSNWKPLLWVVDATSSTMGENRTSLGLFTWADKCTWGSSSTLYCAVPLSLDNNAGLQRSLFEDESDALYKINLSTGATQLLAIPEDETSMNNLWVSDNEELLYFNDDSGQLQLLYLE